MPSGFSVKLSNRLKRTNKSRLFFIVYIFFILRFFAFFIFRNFDFRFWFRVSLIFDLGLSQRHSNFSNMYLFRLKTRILYFWPKYGIQRNSLFWTLRPFSKLRFRMKISIYVPKFWSLSNIFIFWKRVLFLTKISIFEPEFSVLHINLDF